MTERLLKLINLLEAGKTTVFARKCGIAPSTMTNYIQGRPLNAESIIRICETYNVNANWLLTGKGEPFTDTETAPTATESPEVADLLRKTHRVLTSGTLYSAALASNIAAFHDSVDKAEKGLELLEEINRKLSEKDQFKERLNKIESVVDRLSNTVQGHLKDNADENTG